MCERSQTLHTVIVQRAVDLLPNRLADPLTIKTVATPYVLVELSR
jgi:hypothetical protein